MVATTIIQEGGEMVVDLPLWRHTPGVPDLDSHRGTTTTAAADTTKTATTIATSASTCKHVQWDHH